MEFVECYQIRTKNFVWNYRNDTFIHIDDDDGEGTTYSTIAQGEAFWDMIHLALPSARAEAQHYGLGDIYVHDISAEADDDNNNV